ncbi:MAG: transposase family protein [Pseudonocardiaceae bacterium]
MQIAAGSYRRVRATLGVRTMLFYGTFLRDQIWEAEHDAAKRTNDDLSDRRDQDISWPPILGLFKSLVVALTYLRRNRAQAELGETFGVSQSTISRAISGVTSLLGEALKGYVPTADELDGSTQYIVDGTLLPCWSWAAHPELYSGKHKTTGMNVQISCTLSGRLAYPRCSSIRAARRVPTLIGRWELRNRVR